MERDKMSNKSTRLFRDTPRHYASCHGGDIHIFSQHRECRAQSKGVCMCEYVYVREYTDSILWARASTYEGTESRRVSSMDENGEGMVSRSVES
ncbi:hypothetical protein ALC57_16016 [Trachymyrmex cornetzi]|uniref:Uncharacterized protein n=1 Tax=Trachymyrmex cornetzi TaxID=471704 RepID=A0A195DG58_9HYME|nr:hypothetical protein ALC57_16016 [Trachymyrmex cornetzi]